LPSAEARIAIFKSGISKTEHTLQEGDFEELGRLTENYSGSDISIITKDAIMGPVR